MLGARRVRELLLEWDCNADGWFNAYAYFEYGHDTAPLTADDVWIFQAHEPGGEQEYAYGLLPRVPASPTTPAMLIDLMARAGGCDMATHALLLALGADAPWLAEREVSALLGPRVRLSLQRARQWLARDFDSVWSEFVRVARNHRPFEEPNTLPRYDEWFYAVDVFRRELTAALVRRADLAAEAAAAVLSSATERDGPLERCSIKLLKRVPCVAAVDRLIQRTASDDFYDREDACDALTRIGSVALAQRLVEECRAGRPRLFDTVSRIRRPESERMLVELLRESHDLATCFEIADSLSYLFPTEGIEDMLDLTLSPRCMDDCNELPICNIVTAAETAGYEGPKLELARKRRDAFYEPRARYPIEAPWS